MKLNEYQEQASITAIYRDTDLYALDPFYGELYCALQLAAEAGEVAGKYGKVLRKGEKEIDRDAIVKEMGDVLWYLANLASELNVSLEDVAQINLLKLRDRKERNVIHGSGDDR